MSSDKEPNVEGFQIERSVVDMFDIKRLDVGSLISRSKLMLKNILYIRLMSKKLMLMDQMPKTLKLRCLAARSLMSKRPLLQSLKMKI